MSKKNKEKVVIDTLIHFLNQNSFTPKQENDIWSKFGYLLGTNKYCLRNLDGNKVQIVSVDVDDINQQKTYTYYKKQVDDQEYAFLYQKEYVDWNNDLIYVKSNKKWMLENEIPPKPIYTQEEDAISIIESILLSKLKNSKKENIPLELDQSDFQYQYFGSNKKWIAFMPNTEKLLNYAKKFNRTEFENFINSQEYLQQRMKCF